MRELPGGGRKVLDLGWGSGYTVLKTQPAGSLKSLHFTACTLCLNKKKRKVKKKEGYAEAWRPWEHTHAHMLFPSTLSFPCEAAKEHSFSSSLHHN